MQVMFSWVNVKQDVIVTLSHYVNFLILFSIVNHTIFQVRVILVDLPLL